MEVVISGYGEQAAMVQDGRADLALIGSPAEATGLDTEPLLSEPRFAALPLGHELAGRPALDCADLVGYPMPVWPGAGLAERIFWAGRDHDLPEGPEIHDISQLMETVALGQAIALVPAPVLRHHPRADVVYRPVRDATPHTTVVAWPAGSRSRRIARFVRVAMEVAAEPALAV